MDEELELFKEQLDIVKLEEEWGKLPQVEIPLTHDFIGGVYLRTILIPAGTLVIGKRHRYETCNLLLSGEMSTYMGKDIPVRRDKGPAFFKSKPEVKKLGYAHTNSIFVNIIPTLEMDLDEIEKKIIISEEEFKLKYVDKGELK
jgi:hypothetical protein